MRQVINTAVAIRLAGLIAALICIALPAGAADPGPSHRALAVTVDLIDTTNVDVSAISGQIADGPNHDSLLRDALLKQGAVLITSPTLDLVDGDHANVSTNSDNTLAAVEVHGTILSNDRIQVSLNIYRTSGERTSHINVSQGVTNGQAAEMFKDDQGPAEHLLVFAKATILDRQNPPATGDFVATSGPPAAVPSPVVNTLPDSLNVAWDGSTVAVPKRIDLPADFYESMTYKAWLDVGGAATLSFDQPDGSKTVVTVRGYLNSTADPKTPLIAKIDDLRPDGSRRATTLYGTALDLPIQWSHLATDGSTFMDRVFVDTAKDGTRFIQYVDLFLPDGTGLRYQGNQYGVAYMQWAIESNGLIKRKLKGSSALNVAPKP